MHEWEYLLMGGSTQLSFLPGHLNHLTGRPLNKRKLIIPHQANTGCIAVEIFPRNLRHYKSPWK